MISDWLAWAKGRSLWLSVAAWVAALVFTYTLWWRKVFGPWSPHLDDYAISALEIAPIIAGLIAIYGILPRMDWIDAQAVSHPGKRDLVAAAALISGFALIPPLARWLFSLNPIYASFIPSEYLHSDPTELLRVVPYNLMWAYTLFIIGVLSFGVLATGFAGRTFGPILGMLGYFATLFIQGYRLIPALIPRILDRNTPDVLPATCLIVPIMMLVIGLTIFRLSDSGVTHIGGWLKRTSATKR